ncbi:MAG: helix-turn-helix domain-containing protein, partial [Terriglobales bacterium]
HFAQQVCAQNNWKSIPFTPEAIQELKMHSWAGNIRELRNVVERLILLATDGEVTLATVVLALPQTSSSPPAGYGSTAGSGALAERVQGFEREVILAELKRNHRHITNTAKALGLERSHLYKKAEQLGIDLQALRNEPSDVGGTT